MAFNKETQTPLNAQQERAVSSNNERVLVLAGAGTGKTQTLTKRIIRLLNEGIDGEKILAVTFTNKAAGEIKDRVVAGNTNGTDVMIGTFHGICNNMIRAHHFELGLSPYYQIIDSKEQRDLIKEIVAEDKDMLSVDEYQDISNAHIVKLSYSKIMEMKEAGIMPDSASNPIDVDWDLVEIYKRYEGKKEVGGLLDFADLLILGVKLLKIEEIQKKFNSIIEHMLVDEFQDTNSIQMEWIRLLNCKNLFVVGDDDQSIYKFRGADVSHILNFPDNYDNPEVIYLEENYRSSENILTVANNLISFNQTRHEKKLWTAKEGGELVNIKQYSSSHDEAKSVIKKISSLINSGVCEADIAIIYRANYLSRNFEKPLARLGIPYKITGGVGFWQRKEIKDVLSYLVFYSNKKNHLALERCCGFPTRGIGKKTISRVREYSYENNRDLLEATREMASAKLLKGKAKGSLVKLVELFDDFEHSSISDMITEVIEFTGCHSIYSSEDDKERLDNLNELIAAAIEFENEDISLEDFLSNTSLLGSVDDSGDHDCVNLTTAHSSKGLEFPFVFIIGMEEGVFPSARALESIEDIEEERRLGYVSITRAKKELFISHASTRTVGGDFNKRMFASRFILEMGEDGVKSEKKLWY